MPKMNFFTNYDLKFHNKFLNPKHLPVATFLLKTLNNFSRKSVNYHCICSLFRLKHELLSIKKGFLVIINMICDVGCKGFSLTVGFSNKSWKFWIYLLVQDIMRDFKSSLLHEPLYSQGVFNEGFNDRWK